MVDLCTPNAKKDITFREETNALEDMNMGMIETIAENELQPKSDASKENDSDLRESTLDSENESNPTSEEDTANGAELNKEPTHNSNGTDSRRCSENESNPTNEGDTATGAELSEEPTHHNSNGTESRKRDDDAVTQAECSASKRAKFEPPNEIVVEGSSMSQVNGVYKRNADYNYAPQYCKQGVYGGSNATYRIYRTQWRGWCIGAKYHCSVLYYTTTSLMLPPIDGWFACGGRKAAPTLVYNQSCNLHLQIL